MECYCDSSNSGCVGPRHVQQVQKLWNVQTDKLMAETTGRTLNDEISASMVYLAFLGVKAALLFSNCSRVMLAPV